MQIGDTTRFKPFYAQILGYDPGAEYEIVEILNNRMVRLKGYPNYLDKGYLLCSSSETLT